MGLPIGRKVPWREAIPSIIIRLSNETRLPAWRLVGGLQELGGGLQKKRGESGSTSLIDGS